MRAKIEELIQKSLEGDNDAFSQPVYKYQYAVYGLAFHYLKNFDILPIGHICHSSESWNPVCL